MPKSISGRPNGEELLPEGSNPRCCPDCGLYTHKWDDICDFKKKIKEHWSVSREGVQIISAEFRSILDSAKVENIEYKPLSNGCFAFRPQKLIFLDFSSFPIERQDLCKTCNRFCAVLGGGVDAPIMNGQKLVGPMDIVRAGQAFGSARFFVQDSIFGDELAKILQSQGWRSGIDWGDCPQSC